MNFLKLTTGFGRNALTLTTGMTIAQGISIAASPILTRIYTPEDFGVFALYIAIVTIISIIATGRYELAIMLPKKDEDALNIMVLSIGISLFVSLLFFGIILIFHTEILGLLGNTELSSWLYFIPISVFLTSIYQSLRLWLNRKSKYKEMSVVSVSQSAVTVGSNLSLGLGKFGNGGLIIGHMIGQFVAVLMTGKAVTKESKTLFKKVNKDRIILLAKRYGSHPKYLIYSYGLASVYTQAPMFFIGRVFDFATLGFYSLANKFINLPGNLIANSLGDIFTQKAAEEYNEEGRFDGLLLSTVKNTFFISVIPFSIFFFLAPNIFAFVFGSTWLIAGEYAQILTIGAFFAFVATPVDKAALITNKISYIYKWHSAKFIFYIILFWLTYSLNADTKQFLYGLTFVNVLFYIIGLYWEYRFSKGKNSD